MPEFLEAIAGIVLFVIGAWKFFTAGSKQLEPEWWIPLWFFVTCGGIGLFVYAVHSLPLCP